MPHKKGIYYTHDAAYTHPLKVSMPLLSDPWLHLTKVRIGTCRPSNNQYLYKIPENIYTQNYTKILAPTLLYMLKCTIIYQFESNFTKKVKTTAKKTAFNKVDADFREIHILIYTNFLEN